MIKRAFLSFVFGFMVLALLGCGGGGSGGNQGPVYDTPVRYTLYNDVVIGSCFLYPIPLEYRQGKFFDYKTKKEIPSKIKGEEFEFYWRTGETVIKEYLCGNQLCVTEETIEEVYWITGSFVAKKEAIKGDFSLEDSVCVGTVEAIKGR